LITDKLGSCGAAKKQVMPGVEHRSHKGLHNRAENSHVSFRKRERILQHFRSAGALQRFVSVFSAVRNLFVPPRQNSRQSSQPHERTWSADLGACRLKPMGKVALRPKLMNHLAGSWHHLHFDGTITILLSITMEVPLWLPSRSGTFLKKRIAL